MHGRHGFGVVLFAMLVASSGCLGILTDGTATFEASQATVADGTLDETGYELSQQKTQNVSRSFTVAGQDRTVRVVNHLVEYQRNVSLGPLGSAELARFVVFSTPAVEVAGQTLNPVGDWSEKRLVRKLSSQYSGLSDVSHVNNRSVRILGEERTVGKFSGRATVLDDREIDVLIHVTKFPHGDDFVVAIGVHPERLPDEQQRVDSQFRGVEH